MSKGRMRLPSWKKVMVTASHGPGSGLLLEMMEADARLPHWASRFHLSRCPWLLIGFIPHTTYHGLGGIHSSGGRCHNCHHMRISDNCLQWYLLA